MKQKAAQMWANWKLLNEANGNSVRKGLALEALVLLGMLACLAFGFFIVVEVGMS